MRKNAEEKKCRENNEMLCNVYFPENSKYRD